MLAFLILLLITALGGVTQSLSDVSIVVTTIPRVATTSRWILKTATEQSHTVTYTSKVLPTIAVTFTPAPSSPPPVSGLSSISSISPPTPVIPAPQASPVIISSTERSISGAALAGLLIGIVAIVIVLLIGFIWCYKKKNQSAVSNHTLPLTTRDRSGNWVDDQGRRMMNIRNTNTKTAPTAPEPIQQHAPPQGTPQGSISSSALFVPKPRATGGRLRRTDDCQFPLPLSLQTPGTQYESSFDDSKRDQRREAARAQLEGQSEARPARPYTPSVYSRDEETGIELDHRKSLRSDTCGDKY